MKPENRKRIDTIIATFDQSLQDIEVTAKNVRLIVERLERGEGSVGKLDDNALEEFELAIKDARRILSPVNRLNVTVDYRGEAQGMK